MDHSLHGSCGAIATGAVLSTERGGASRLRRSRGGEGGPMLPNELSTEIVRVDPSAGQAFSAISNQQDDILVVRFRGRGEPEALDLLKACLRAIPTGVRRFPMSQLKLDFSELYVLAPICFRAFVSWIVPLSKRAVSPFRIVLVVNPKLSWQTRSLNSLRFLAPGLVTIEVAEVR